MAKQKTAYVCSDCGAEHTQWQGQCMACNEWNTLTRILLGPATAPSAPKNFKRPPSGGDTGAPVGAVQTLGKIDLEEQPRFTTTIGEFDRVLGGGLVPGSAVLIGGNPGAGKSTLLLQVMCHLSQTMEALYVTGEESLQQVGMRAKRLGLPMDNLKMLAETNVTEITRVAEECQPKIIVVDSIQVMYSADVTSAPGSVSQVRECAAYLIQYAKQTGTALFLVGHVTKDGTLAGPKVLEHMIDCFMMLDGDGDSRYRTLRGQKNRFGAVNELGVFAMTGTGMKEVKNPSAIFLAREEEISPGSIVVVLWEGTRPLLVEIQALVDASQYGNPRRVSVGLDNNRVAMLLAVLHRHGGMFMADQDVFVNVVGGVRVAETSADLAVLLAIVSSFRDKALPRELVVFGEVGLAGEIRPVPSGQERLSEAAKHGFTRAIVPKANAPKKKIDGMDVIAVSKLSDAIDALLSNL
jgi:DNA repair protein RadA/Sms